VLEILVNPQHGALERLEDINAVGHRMVHGGEIFKTSALVNAKIMEILHSLIPLAPLHNPANIIGIEAVQEILP
jgi:acetate kinase